MQRCDRHAPRRRMPIVSGRTGSWTVAFVLAVATLSTGCLTGERPTLVERPTVDDPAVQAVLDRLGSAPSAEFTASYEITSTGVGVPTDATVVQSGTRRRVTVGAVDFLSDGTVARTCENNDQGCVDFLDDARISDLNITHRFWGDAFEARLRLDAGRRLGFSQSSLTTIAGAPAACVDIPLPSNSELTGTVQYCALDAGPLARYIGADVTIELTEFSPSANPASFDR